MAHPSSQRRAGGFPRMGRDYQGQNAPGALHFRCPGFPCATPKLVLGVFLLDQSMYIKSHTPIGSSCFPFLQSQSLMSMPDASPILYLSIRTGQGLSRSKRASARTRTSARHDRSKSFRVTLRAAGRHRRSAAFENITDHVNGITHVGAAVAVGVSCANRNGGRTAFEDVTD